MFRFAFNTAFLPENNILTFELKDLDPDSVQKSKRFPKDFQVEVKFRQMCKCTNITPFSEKCSQCVQDLEEDTVNWNQIAKIINSYKKNTLIESKILLFGDPGCDDVEETISSKNPISAVKDNHQNSDSSEGEDELVKIFDKVLTRKGTRKATKKASLEMMENLEKKYEEEKKEEEEEEKIDEPDDKKMRVMKTKSFLITSPLKLVQNESKSKEN